MCTASWRWEHGEPELWFNRDEQRSRPPALPPRTDANGATYPMDPQGGGTWIFVNRHGLIGALLNGYTPPPPGSLRSRGLLLKELADCESPETFGLRLAESVQTNLYASFYVLALRDTAQIWHWDGTTLAPRTSDLPMLTTSSFAAETVLAARHARFLEIVKAPSHPARNELDSFHAWHDTAAPHRSVHMSRPDARTVSLTRISGGQLEYLPIHASGGVPKR